MPEGTKITVGGLSSWCFFIAILYMRIIAPDKGKPFFLNLLIPVFTEKEEEKERVCAN